MANRIEFTNVTVPAGTAIATPVRIRPTFDEGRVDRIEMRWPPGPSGLVGLRVGHSGQVIIPFDASTYLVTDDEVIGWDIENFPEAQAWFIDGYNTDVYNHTIQFRWLITDAAPAQPARPALVPIPVG